MSSNILDIIKRDAHDKYISNFVIPGQEETVIVHCSFNVLREIIEVIKEIISISFTIGDKSFEPYEIRDFVQPGVGRFKLIEEDITGYYITKEE